MPEAEPKKKKKLKKGQKELNELNEFTQTDNIGRKKWDLEKYKEEALAKLKSGEEDAIYSVGLYHSKGGHSAMKKKTRADELLEQKPTENLQQRNYAVDVFKNVGKYQVVTANAQTAQKGGWYCDTCECLLKDSNSYLDHINGKKHQRRLGMTMRIERSTLGDVKKRLAQHKRKQDRVAEGGGDRTINEMSVEERMEFYEKQQQDKKRQRKERKKMLQEERALRGEDEEEDEEKSGRDVADGQEQENEEEGEGELTEEQMMAQMMGFSGFTATVNT